MSDIMPLCRIFICLPRTAGEQDLSTSPVNRNKANKATTERFPGPLVLLSIGSGPWVPCNDFLEDVNGGSGVKKVKRELTTFDYSVIINAAGLVDPRLRLFTTKGDGNVVEISPSSPSPLFLCWWICRLFPAKNIGRNQLWLR
jgi:hypothetical protein